MHKKISKIGQITLALLSGTILTAAAILSAIAWTHLIQEMFKPKHYVGDTYEENYTVTEIVGRHITAVVDNSNQILYDVMYTSGGSRYLAGHLNESGLPVKQTESISSERPTDPVEFDFVTELDNSRFMLCCYEIILFIMLYIAHLAYPLLSDAYAE